MQPSLQPCSAKNSSFFANFLSCRRIIRWRIFCIIVQIAILNWKHAFFACLIDFQPHFAHFLYDFGTSKYPQKSMKNYSKINLGVILGGSWASWRPRPKNKAGNSFFGTLLGPSWRPLGPSWRPLRTVLAVLAASWARLGLVLEAEIRANIDPKIDQNFDASWDRYFIRFYWNFN